MIRNWVVLDLDVFRRCEGDSGIRCEHQDNKDGTYFIAYDIRSFPSELIVAASPTMLIALETGVNAVEPLRTQSDEQWQRRAERVRQPNLQQWVERFGGYHKIPWAEWDRAVAEWHVLRRDTSEWP
jgi:hypothetical protein